MKLKKMLRGQMTTETLVKILIAVVLLVVLIVGIFFGSKYLGDAGAYLKSLFRGRGG